MPRSPTPSEVLARIDPPGDVYVALLSPTRGPHNARAAVSAPDEVNVVVSASETHDRTNVNRSLEESSRASTVVRVPARGGPAIR